ncbi:MAG: hypothetical protein J5U19_12030 [Candidatus Methanoperedens sp.]|nr:hypothetical protein [Candidatus Methanoperedens sp.]
MTTFEIKDEDINVEDIMRHIRENIKKRRESGAYTKEMEKMINQPLQAPSTSEASGDLKQNVAPNDLQQDLDYINSNRDLHAEYHIAPTVVSWEGPLYVEGSLYTVKRGGLRISSQGCSRSSTRCKDIERYRQKRRRNRHCLCWIIYAASLWSSMHVKKMIFGFEMQHNYLS